MTGSMSDTIADRRLQPVLDAIAARRLKVLSLDVFDTLLWRRVPEPHDVFLLLGRALSDSGRLAPGTSALQFAELRRLAEARAREKKQAVTGYREITLADIYAEFPPFLFAPGVAPAAVRDAELELEAGLMVLDRELAALAARARAAGVRVILISDTYFSSAEVAAFVARAGWAFAADVERIVVSCEAGKPKWRDLFPALLPQLGVAPHEMMHVGDSVEADLAPCQRAGIPCAAYGKWTFSTRAQAHEWPAEPLARAALLGGAGDFGLTGLRSRLAHRAPAALPEDLRFFWGYGAAMLAPAFAAFARWIVQSAAAARADIVYGLMREGRFLKRVIDATAQAMGVTLDVRELWLSRRAVIRAGLYPGEHDLIGEYVLAAPGRTTDDILANLGLARADLAAADPALAGFEATRPQAFVTLTKAIAVHPALRAKIEAHSARYRPGLLKGLARAIPFARNPRVMLVDLGYVATIQAVLARILRRENVRLDMTGLYFALNEKAAINVMNGVDLRAFLGPEGFGSEAVRVLTRTPDVLEHASMCEEGSLAGYDDAGDIELLPSRRSDKQLAEMRAMQAGIMAGVDAVNALLGPLAQTPAVGNDALARQVAAQLSAAMLYPTVDEARRIGAWRHEAKVDAMPASSFTATTFDFSRLEYGGWAALQTATRDQVYWPAATFQIADASLAAAYAAGVRGAYRPEQLVSNPLLGGLGVCPDLGVGFDERREGKVALNVNAFGRGFVSATLKGPGPEVFRRLRLRWPAARAVIQLDQCVAVYTTEQGVRRVDLLAEPPGTLAWSGARPLDAAALLASAEAAVVLDLAAVTPAALHGLDLELRFKYLQLDSILGAG